MPFDAPYSGGLSPGAHQFAVDGDFTSCDPCSPPKITFPFKGDSVFSYQDVLFYDAGAGDYAPVPLGTNPNIQPWSPNQAAFMVEQDFMVALEAYVPLALNTPYDDIWSIGWTSTTSTGYPLPDLSAAILVEEGQPVDMGQGIVKITRRFATVPPTRNDVEQFVYTFPGFTSGDNTRQSFSRNVLSRLQYDYFVFDDLNILDSELFPSGGNRLNASTGLYPNGLILAQQNYYAAVADAVANNNFLPPDTLILSDSPDGGTTPGTIPSATDWISWFQGADTSNGYPAELIAESSTMRRFLGNIYERRTRFVLTQ